MRVVELCSKTPEVQWFTQRKAQWYGSIKKLFFCVPLYWRGTYLTYFHNEQLDLPSVWCLWRCGEGEQWKSHLQEEGGQTWRTEKHRWRESQVVWMGAWDVQPSPAPTQPPAQSNRKRHWFLTHKHVRPSSDRSRRTGRSTHRHPLTKQSCTLTSVSCNTAKAQMWVHKKWKCPHRHPQTWTAEGEP